MKKTILILLISLVVTNLTAQKKTTWYAFFAEDGYTRGFKNKNGEVMISPKFMGFTATKNFRNIMAVMEENNRKTSSYYLLKNGKKIGQDSVYFWDMAFDCESEGMIRFKDKETDKVGFFDSKGKIAIPAIYTEALPFRNSVAVVYDGKKTCPDDGSEYDKNKPCEHWYLSDSTTTLLIDKKNKILIKDFKDSNEIDFYSMKKNDKTVLPYRFTQKGEDGNSYSFNNYKKQFEHWFFNEFIERLKFAETAAAIQLPEWRLLENSMSEIYFYNDKIATGKTAKIKAKQFIESNSDYLIETFFALQNEDADYFIGINGLNTMIWDEPAYEKYYDDCGEALIAKYPVFSIVSNYKSGMDEFQEIFKFLKTDKGFKLISIVTPNVKIK